MSAEAPDPADRFRFHFRFSDSNPSSASRDRTRQTSKMPSDFNEFLPKKMDKSRAYDINHSNQLDVSKC